VSSYAGVTFAVVMSDPRSRPVWSRRAVITERVMPYANKEDVQSVGLSNWRITVPITLTSAADLATLQAAQGVTKRTLSDFFGSSHSNTMLTNVGDPDQWENTVRIVVDVTFVREGT
jgi:hypothetical protein